MEKYNPKKIESKRQRIWEEKEIYKAEDKSKKGKKYILIEFPYPSGAGLHVGHCRPYCALDALARKKKMEGNNILFPIGWDAFGLPTENFAIKNKIHPKKATEKNIANFKRQIKSLGLSFDWSREINTTDPKYYKWTQWIFLKLFENGLAYQAEMPINWCPSCKIGLANEEVVDGKCERCGTPTEKKIKKQWMLKITAYADKLIEGLKKVDYPERVKVQQINWIGKSEGAEVKFQITNSKQNYIKVFTTRPDTLFGCTYMVVCPEHKIISNLKSYIVNYKEVEKYLKKVKKKSDLDRTDLAKEKTGVELKGIKAINPVNKKEIPIWVADYVLPHYGTGAIMAVPAHDKRDFEFAKKFGLEIKQVVKSKNKKLAIIIHGSPRKDTRKNPDYISDNKRHWIPWIKQQLEKNNFKVCAPLMPAPWRPDYEEWKKEIEKLDLDINKESILIGHSAGGAFLVRWLSEKQTKINKLILIAPSKVIIDDNIRLKHFNDFKIDKNVKKLAQEIKIFISNDEIPYRIKNSEIYKKELNAKLIRLKNKGHFTFKGMGIKEFPELLEEIFDEAYIEDGIAINSGQFDGFSTKEFKEKITKWLEEKGVGKKAVNYKLRDWIFSRQHYWGEPIPLVHCKKCGIIPIPEKDLPVELPFVDKYEPAETGESPLTNISKWVNVKCPKCGGPAKRETDTMPNWAGSSWYYLRYLDPKNDKALADFEKIKYWMPVDFYNGGMEHTTLHLLYSRFWHKFLFDIGIVSQNEPYQKRTSHGMVLAEDGRKMSKSFGNVINPDDVVEKFGADALRLYEMFMGPFEQTISWNEKGLVGMERFLEKVWQLFENFQFSNHKSQTNLKFPPAVDSLEADKIQNSKLERLLHQTIKKVTEDIDNFKFNTAIAQLMILLNEMEKKNQVASSEYQVFLKLLSPFAPHISEEIWQQLKSQKPNIFKSIFEESWPEYDKKLIKEEKINLIIQINGKVRDQIEVNADIPEQEAKEIALSQEKVVKWIKGKEIKKVIFVKGKLINIVV
jgi:leucyl-tRNA synthetase